MVYTTSRRGTVNRLTGMAILIALIFVLQTLSNYVSFGTVSITLALTPIIIGGAVYGPKAGAGLGFAFGIIVLIAGLSGLDKSFAPLMEINPFALIACIFIKGIACGYLSALTFHGITDKGKNESAIPFGVVASGIICPLVNTGIFVLVLITSLRGFFGPDISASAAFIMLIGLIGFNFLVELVVNLILSAGITRIIRTVT